MTNLFRVYKDEDAMLKVYNRRLGIADSVHRSGEGERERLVNRYRGVAEEDQITSRGHRVSVTTGTSVVDTMYASMTAVDVEFICESVGHGTRAQALVTGRALNQAWHDSKGQKRAKRAIKDALTADIGWVKVYYDKQVARDIRDVPEDALEAQVTVLRAQGMTDKAIEDELKVVEEVDIVVRDRVCVEHVSWKNIRFDTTAKYIDDVRWAAQYTRLPRDEVTMNPKWEAFVFDRYGPVEGKRRLDDLRADSSVLTQLEGNYADIEDLGADGKEDDQRITVVEMWDFETGLVTVFPRQQCDLVLFQYPNPLMFNADLEDRNPFKPLVVRDDPENLEGLGDMRIIKPALEELDEYRSNVATYVARTIPKVIGPERAMTPAGKKALQSRVWGEYVGLNGDIPAGAVQPLIPPPLPQATYQVMETILFEVNEAVGASEPMRGVFATKRTTATETQIVTSAGELRQAERRGELEYWYLSIARTALQLMQLFYDQDRMDRYTDDVGEEFVWEWNKEDIAIDADIRIALTPRENLTRPQRVERALGFMNLALPLPETDRGELLKFVAREMGYRDEDIRAVVKSDEEVKAEQQQQQVAAQLSVRPQPFGNSPQGLNVSSGGGGAA